MNIPDFDPLTYETSEYESTTLWANGEEACGLNSYSLPGPGEA